MIIWGGVDFVGFALSTGGRYNPSNDSWRATSTSNTPLARYYHTAVWTGSEMIVWGGQVVATPTARPQLADQQPRITQNTGREILRTIRLANTDSNCDADSDVNTESYTGSASSTHSATASVEIVVINR